jgi:hypothetical protein
MPLQRRPVVYPDSCRGGRHLSVLQRRRHLSRPGRNLATLSVVCVAPSLQGGIFDFCLCSGGSSDPFFDSVAPGFNPASPSFCFCHPDRSGEPALSEVERGSASLRVAAGLSPDLWGSRRFASGSPASLLCLLPLRQRSNLPTFKPSNVYSPPSPIFQSPFSSSGGPALLSSLACYQ